MNYIYSYTNKINGHQYIGQTDNIERRKREHRSNANNPLSKEYSYLFHKKLREYGEENFIFSILQELKDTEDINEAEKFWIEKFKTYVGDNNGGYNLTRGGQDNSHNAIYDLEIKNIKNDIKNKVSFNEIKNKYGISISHISAINHGTYYRDENETYPLCKYYKDKDEIKYIKDLIKTSNIPLTKLAEDLGICYSSIKKINSGKMWNDINDDYPLRKISTNKSRAIQIQNMLIEGKSNIEIINITGASVETIRRINLGETHKDSSLTYPLRPSL